MVDDLRTRILHAAGQVYAQHGWRGATTRRIADEAGVNEVTLFRHFGSKDVLLETTIRELGALDDVVAFPEVPTDPENEMMQWMVNQYQHIASRRALVQQMMSDALERPHTAQCASQGPNTAAAALRDYVVKLRRHGLVSDVQSISPTEAAAAVTMLMGALFSDAMHRDLMPEMFSQSVDDSLRAYVRIFLRGLGALSSASTEPTAAPLRTPVRPSTTSAISE